MIIIVYSTFLQHELNENKATVVNLVDARLLLGRGVGYRVEAVCFASAGACLQVPWIFSKQC